MPLVTTEERDADALKELKANDDSDDTKSMALVTTKPPDIDALKELTANDVDTLTDTKLSNAKVTQSDERGKVEETAGKLKNCSVKMIRIKENSSCPAGDLIKGSTKPVETKPNCSVRVAKLNGNCIRQFMSIKDFIIDAAPKRSKGKMKKKARTNDENTRPKKAKVANTTHTSFRRVPSSAKTRKPSKKDNDRNSPIKMRKRGIYEHKLIKRCTIKVKRMSNDVIRMKCKPNTGSYGKTEDGNVGKEHFKTTKIMANDVMKKCQIKLEKLSEGIEMHSKHKDEVKPCVVNIQKLASITAKKSKKPRHATESENIRGKHKSLRQGTRRSYVYF